MAGPPPTDDRIMPLTRVVAVVVIGILILAWFVLFAVGWIVLQRVVLPRLGVPT